MFKTLIVHRAVECDRRRTRVSVRLIVILGILGVLLIAGIVLVKHYTKDELPPNLADMTVVRLSLPEEENAFTYFNKAVNELQWPKFGSHEADRLSKMLPYEPDWDEELVDRFLNANEGVLELLDKGLSCEACQVPEIEGFDQKLPYLTPWRSMARLARLRALQDFREGLEQQAFERAVGILKFGQLIQDSGGGVVHWLVGRAVSKTGLETIRDLLAATGLDSEQLHPFVANVGTYEMSLKGLGDAYRIEYHVFASMVDEVEEGRYEDLQLSGIKVLRSYQLKPNQTRRIYADLMRLLISSASRYPGEPKTGISEDLRILFDTNDDDAVRRYMRRGNPEGKRLVAMVGPALFNTNKQLRRGNWEVRATKVLIALRCYELEKGGLPENLDALVPEYLDEVPLDPFDEKPLRYSREKGLIYASDEEFVEQGGSLEIRFSPHSHETDE